MVASDCLKGMTVRGGGRAARMPHVVCERWLVVAALPRQHGRNAGGMAAQLEYVATYNAAMLLSDDLVDVVAGRPGSGSRPGQATASVSLSGRELPTVQTCVTAQHNSDIPPSASGKPLQTSKL
jgi:hypothetical protein